MRILSELKYSILKINFCQDETLHYGLVRPWGDKKSYPMVKLILNLNIKKMHH